MLSSITAPPEALAITWMHLNLYFVIFIHLKEHLLIVVFFLPEFIIGYM